MSRIIISRHPNGEEALTAGFDRPLGYFFVDEYNDEGEYVTGIGLLGIEPCPSPDVARRYLKNRYHLSDPVLTLIHGLLEAHRELDYPASNVVVDLTTGEATP